MIQVQYIFAIASIKALDISVLSRFSGLDVLDMNTLCLTIINEVVG